MTKEEKIKLRKYKENIAEQYRLKQKQLQSDKRSLENENKKLQDEVNRLKEINSNLEQTVIQQKDWIERLLEYTNMSEEQLEQVKIDLQVHQQMNKTFTSFYELLFGGYRHGQ